MRVLCWFWMSSEFDAAWMSAIVCLFFVIFVMNFVFRSVLCWCCGYFEWRVTVTRENMGAAVSLVLKFFHEFCISLSFHTGDCWRRMNSRFDNAWRCQRLRCYFVVFSHKFLICYVFRWYYDDSERLVTLTQCENDRHRVAILPNVPQKISFSLCFLLVSGWFWRSSHAQWECCYFCYFFHEFSKSLSFVLVICRFRMSSHIDTAWICQRQCWQFCYFFFMNFRYRSPLC